MGKSETEYDDTMKRSEKIIHQRLSIIIKFNVVTPHNNKGKEL